MKRQEVWQIIKYVMVGAATTAVSVASYWALSSLVLLPNIPSTILSWVISVVFAFFGNKLIVFSSRSFNRATLLKEGSEFLAARTATGVLEVIMMWLLVDIIHLPGTPMKLLTNIGVIILNYVFSKLYIFKNK